MRVYEAIVKGLESIGVEAAFGGAGENDASLLIALKHSRKIKSIIVRNEQAASFMACGYSMYTNRLGFCFATAGPGAFNLFSGLAVAMSDSHPVLAVSGFARVQWSGKGALNETSGLSRTPDSRAMFAATTKRSYFVENPSQVCDILEEAVNMALEGRPGPVHITVPENLTHPNISVDNYRDIKLNVRPVLPDPAEVAKIAMVLAESLRDGKPILLLAGSGAVLSGASVVLRQFVDRFQIPFATTLDGKGVLPESHPLCAGIFANSGNKGAREAFKRARVVLAVGNSFSQNGTFDFHPDLFKGKTLVHINIDAHEISKAYNADYALVSDARAAIIALTEELSRTVGPVAAAQPVNDRHQYDAILHLAGKVHPGQMTQSLSRLLPDNAVVLADAGAHLAWLAYYLDLSRNQNYRKPGGFGPMACHVNGAIGVKLACPERQIIVGCGDGCYLLSGFELLTAVQYNIPVIWIIFNDGEFKLIKLYQMSTFFESGLVDFTNPDYVGYARACGAEGYRAETLEEFERAFQTALASGKPTLIDVAIDRLAIPHYCPSPDGLLAAIVEGVENKLGLH
jgi:acetolactate synthase I/II/III large subunit